MKGWCGQRRSARMGAGFLTGASDKTARLWDAATGIEVMRLRGHRDMLSTARFSNDVRQILTVSADTDKSVRLWDAENGGELVSMESWKSGVNSACFDPSATRIVTASDDRTARVWDVSRTALVSQSRAVAITAALASGLAIGGIKESEDFLMRDAPDDLFAAARAQLLDLSKYSAEDIAARERALNETIAALRAPLQPNCYLSPSQFAKQRRVDNSNAPSERK